MTNTISKQTKMSTSCPLLDLINNDLCIRKTPSTICHKTLRTEMQSLLHSWQITVCFPSSLKITQTLTQAMQCPYKQLRQITDTIQKPADQKTRTLQTKLWQQQCCLYKRNCSISVRACMTRIPLTQSYGKKKERKTGGQPLSLKSSKCMEIWHKKNLLFGIYDVS